MSTKLDGAAACRFTFKEGHTAVDEGHGLRTARAAHAHPLAELRRGGCELCCRARHGVMQPRRDCELGFVRKGVRADDGVVCVHCQREGMTALH